MSQQPVTITFDAAPQAKGRARMSPRGGVYTPATTRNYERGLAWAARAAMGGRPPLLGAVALVARFEIAIPKSWSGARRAAAITGDVRPIARPDLDNLLKSIDACNKIVFSDDRAVVKIDAEKRYSTQPKVTMTFTPLEAQP